jgi:arsenite-transporting ATPase
MRTAFLFIAVAVALCVPHTLAFSKPTRPFANPLSIYKSTPLSSLSFKPSSFKQRSSLFSLKPLLSEIDSQISNNTGDTPVVFVGGKGGVGKTSISSSLAVALASSVDHDCKVLIVSTDPAHSLGDALDVDLRQRNPTGARPKPIMLSDPLTNGRLFALEVDPNAALEEFQSNLELFDVATLSQSLGMNVSPTLLQELGLDELHTLIRNPPPGLDELVALANVLDPKFAEEYDVIVVDTAPTGHTLRMLALPQFLDGFLGTLLKLREKLKGLIQTVQMFMGGATETNGGKLDVDKALGNLEEFQSRTSKLRERLKNASSTKFVVVTIPTILSVRESQRLMKELKEQGVCVSDLVVNQCIGAGDGDGDDVPDLMKTYYERRVSGQQRWINELKEACADVSKSEEYKNNVGEGGGAASDIVVKQVPYYDVELVGVPALGFLGSQTFSDPSFQRLIGFDEEVNGPKVIICGGKGGVGKTTTSSSLAISMAMAGHNVVIVSTDPAHSLGDAIDMNLQGGTLRDVQLIGVPPMSTGSGEEGSLKAMEIDPTSALKEFRDSIDKLIGKSNNGDNSELFSTLSSVGELLDTLPAGTDEVVALAKVIQLIRRGQFDRVVLDTAPTGHTLRMLTTPSFLADLIERVLTVSRKLNSNAAVKMLLASAKSKYDVDDAAEQAKAALLKFQGKNFSSNTSLTLTYHCY